MPSRARVHPARTARRNVGLLSGATYVGLTATIGVAVHSGSDDADTVTVDAGHVVPEVLALADESFSGPATPAEPVATQLTSDGPPLHRGGETSTASAPSTSTTGPTTTVSTSASTSTTVPATTAPPTTAAPSTTPPTTAPDTTSPSTTAPPTTSSSTSQSTTTTTVPTTTTTEPTTTTTQPTTTTTTQPTTTTTSDAS